MPLVTSSKLDQPHITRSFSSGFKVTSHETFMFKSIVETQRNVYFKRGATLALWRGDVFGFCLLSFKSHKLVLVHLIFCIWCHQIYFSYSLLIVNHPCSVTNIKCEPNIICHSLYGHTRLTMLQLLSLNKSFSIQIPIIHEIHFIIKVFWMQNILNLFQ